MEVEMKNILLLLLFLLISCKTYKGKLTVHDHLEYNDSKGKSHFLVTGNYQTKVKINSNKSITIIAENYFEKIKLKIKPKKNIVEEITLTPDETNIYLTSEEIGQPFDLHGKITNKTELSEPVTEIQHCSNSARWETECRWGYENSPDPSRGPNTFCNSIPKGKREIVTQIQTRIYTIDLFFLNDSQSKATLNAQQIKQTKQVLEVRPCVLE